MKGTKAKLTPAKLDGSWFRQAWSELAGQMMAPNEIRRMEGLPEACKVCNKPILMQIFRGTDYCCGQCEDATF